MARVGHAGRGGRPDETARLLASLASYPGSACLVLRLAVDDIERALSGVLIECLSKRVRLVVEIVEGTVPAASNALVAMAARLARRRPRVGTLQSRDILATQQGARLLAVPCDPPAPGDSTLVEAVAPLGAEPLLGLFSKGAEVIVCGSVAPSAVCVAFARHEHRWPADAFGQIAGAAAAGRILKVGPAGIGRVLDEPSPAAGLPFADIAVDGSIKFGSSGIAPTPAGLALALLDGVRDPASVVEPDVTLDLSNATILGATLSGVAGRHAADWLDGRLVFESGFLAEGELAFGGTGAAARAIQAARSLEGRLAAALRDERFRVEVVGVESATRAAGERAGDLAIVPGRDVRIRVAARTATQELARTALAEFLALSESVPGGPGGLRRTLARARHVCVAQIPKALVPWSVTAPAVDG